MAGVLGVGLLIYRKEAAPEIRSLPFGTEVNISWPCVKKLYGALEVSEIFHHIAVIEFF